MARRPRFTWLDASRPEQPFPDPALALREPNGLLAAGGDLRSERLLRAYRQGIFPWYSPGEPILWWCPDPRAVLPVGRLHRSRSLRRAWARGDFACSVDAAFPGVLEACSRIGSGEGVWLGSAMQRAYHSLHRQGHAHSIEIWREGALIGGLYGLALGGVFFGESMFSRADNGSKLALCLLEDLLRLRGVALMDGQVASPHLLRMGFVLTPRDDFLAHLRALIPAQLPPASPWTLPAELAGNRDHAPTGLP